MPHPALDILLFALSLGGVLLTLLGIGGQFVPALLSLGYRYWAEDPRFPTWVPWTLLGLALLAEGVEAVAGLWGARRYGAGREGMIGAAVGGLLGAALGGMLLPPVGAVPGVFVGSFAGTALAEVLMAGRTTEDSMRAGVGAVLGKVIAVAFKWSTGLVILTIFAWRLWLS
jgi:uncharacterized protein YqgC (DUF456 family)